MADNTKDAPRRRADAHFTASEARDALVKTEREKERAAFDARTIKLKALRLEKEQAEALEKARLAALAPPAKTSRTAKKPALQKGK